MFSGVHVGRPESRTTPEPAARVAGGQPHANPPRAEQRGPRLPRGSVTAGESWTRGGPVDGAEWPFQCWPWTEV